MDATGLDFSNAKPLAPTSTKKISPPKTQGNLKCVGKHSVELEKVIESAAASAVQGTYFTCSNSTSLRCVIFVCVNLCN
ncbi:hypothetical protein TrLO_g3862 [Triparma laevis f. longispina]|uniref:Uncharacterized protein n=1 Tax=Triparma laevis f. longispina TaxID=1714387 RepID=A0A9W7AGA0_9STRA|nr:hypothetical protein TrLO_g3862 [Triparma laevis f. longispina]